MYSFQNTHSEKLFDSVGFSFHALPSSFLNTPMYSHVLFNISNFHIFHNFFKWWIQSLTTDILFMPQFYTFTENCKSRICAYILCSHMLNHKHLRKWDAPYCFHDIHIFKEKKKWIKCYLPQTLQKLTEDKMKLKTRFIKVSQTPTL